MVLSMPEYFWKSVSVVSDCWGGGSACVLCCFCLAHPLLGVVNDSSGLLSPEGSIGRPFGPARPTGRHPIPSQQLRIVSLTGKGFIAAESRNNNVTSNQRNILL